MNFNLSFLGASAYPPNNPQQYPPSNPYPYPSAQQPSAPQTGVHPPPTAPGMHDIIRDNFLSSKLFCLALDGSGLPYPAGYMQPFLPMPPGYNPYNPYNMSK